MTTRDWKDIKNLHYIHRFIPASLARLYGLSHQRILQILNDTTFAISDTECILCGLEEEVNLFYIDGNEDNYNPQNVISLCEADKRRIRHLQLRRIRPQV